MNQSPTKRYVGVATLAAWFGVLSTTVLKWRERYADFPQPDVEVQTGGQIVYGWDPSRRQELMAWHTSRLGQGYRSDLRLYQHDSLARKA